MNDEIKRAGPPTTRNGAEWEIVLTGEPPAGWVQLFRRPGDSTSGAAPQAVFFRGRIALFRTSEDQVEHWIKSIDDWIGITNRRFGELQDEKKREREQQESTETTDKERIRRLNERFKDL